MTDETNLPTEEIKEFAALCDRSADNVDEIADEFGSGAEIPWENFMTWIDLAERMTAVPPTVSKFAAVEWQFERFEFAKQYDDARKDTGARLSAIADFLRTFGADVKDGEVDASDTDYENSSEIANGTDSED